MNVVNSGSRFQIYGEDLKTYRQLPIGSYEVCFNKMMGFYLISHNELEVNEEKIYGSYEVKVDKVLNAFQLSSRNFGVILSGPKGVGKSLFARILANKAVEASIPLIIVSQYIPGIADFISSIEQEVIVLFDEFEKTFSKSDDNNPQDEMLSLFDGIDSGKKLFIITCNEVDKLNSYLLNRPGRFHYHFTLGNPSPEEVEQYLQDKLDPKYYDNIERIVSFSMGANLTYDCLRAICFELNRGYSLKDTLMDLNISKDRYVHFDIHVEFTDGFFADAKRENIDIYSDRSYLIWFYNKQFPFGLNFIGGDVQYNAKTGSLILDPKDVELSFDDDDFDERIPEEAIAELKKKTIKSITIRKCKDDFVSRYLV